MRPLHVTWPLILVACLTLVTSLPGQVRLGQPAEVTNVFPPVPRELRQHLATARAALADERYGDAVDLLGRLLASGDLLDQNFASAGQQDYFLGESTKPGTLISLKAEAQRLLGTMPEDGRALYELKFGADARQLLQRAIEARDLQRLGEVTRRYFHTDAGYEATMLIGRNYLDQGRPLAAALRFQRLEASTYALQRYDPELSVLLATCWLMADMPDRARATLEGLEERVPNSKLRVGRRVVSLFDASDPTLMEALSVSEEQRAAPGAGVDRVLSWLEQIIGRGLDGQLSEATQWTVFRGNAARNAESAGGMALFSPRWRVQTANHPSDEELIESSKRMYEEQSIPIIPTLHPLAVSNVIVMRSPRRLFGIDFETGKRLWEFPWFEATDEEALRSERFRPPEGDPYPQALELNRRIWDDAPYGQISSDGECVFALWGLASGAVRPSVLVQPFGVQRPNESNASSNKLVALDLKAEGKLRWIVGDEHGTDEPKLAGAFFLGPPLPLMGQLYALAEINESLQLVVLDPNDGSLVWSQQLAYVDAQSVEANPERRAAGATPSYSDGVLVCPTSCGAVVAVDVSSRSLLWGYQYPISGPRPRIGIRYRYTPKQIGERWSDATVTISEGRVLLTPVESDRLYCLDLVSGEEVWEPRERDDLLFAGCVHRHNAIMVGTKQLEAISLDSGETQWECQLPSGMPSGRGMSTDGHYFLPTTARRLLKIELATGRVVESIGTDTTLGNLVAYQDQIISQNVDWLTAYYQTAPLRRVVDQRLAKNPEDSWALARRAELLLHDGEHGEALKVFQLAYRLDPEDDAIRASLVRSLLDALRDDFAANRGYAEELESLINRPAERADYFHSMAVGLKEQGEHQQAADYFIRLAFMDDELGEMDQDDEIVRLDDTWLVTRSRWLRVQIQELLAKADPASRQAIDAKIREHLEGINENSSITRLRRFAEHFGDHPAGRDVRMMLARKLLTSGQQLQAEMELITLENAENPETAGTAAAMLTRLLLENGKFEEAAIYAQKLREQWGDVTVLDGKTGQEMADAALQNDALRQWIDRPNVWPDGKCEVMTQNRRTLSSYLRQIPIYVDAARGPFPWQQTIVYNQTRNSVDMTDALGRKRQQVLLGERLTSPAPGQASAYGHLLVLNIGFTTIALDTLRTATADNDARLWDTDLSGQRVVGNNRRRSALPRSIPRKWGPNRVVLTDNLQRPLGMIGPITEKGMIYQMSQDIKCVDPLSGDTIWVRSGFEPGCDIFGDQEYLFVVAPDDTEAIVLRTADGQALERRDVTSRTERWITAGRNVLTCRDDGRTLLIRYFDAWTREELWNIELDDDTQCWRPSRDEIAMLEPDGMFHVLSVQSGEAVVQCRLEAPKSLKRLYVLPSNQGYTVIASGDRPPTKAPAPRGVFGTIGSDLCPEINGYLYSVDRESGQPHWNRPAKIYHYFLPLDQPTHAPTLFFLQNLRKPVANSPTRTEYKASVLVLDKRDGRKLFLADDLDRLLTYAIEAIPNDQTVVLRTNTNQFTLQFTDQAAEPAEAFQMQLQAEESTAMKNFNKIAGAILDAIAENAGDADPPEKKQPPAKKDP
jgi:outer membrane protein assembly factor BamB